MQITHNNNGLLHQELNWYMKATPLAPFISFSFVLVVVSSSCHLRLFFFSFICFPNNVDTLYVTETQMQRMFYL